MKNTVIWLIFGLLVISNAVLALLFLNERGKAASLAQPVAASEDAGEVAGETTSEQETTVSAAEESNERGVYRAKAANFSLTLDDEYSIIVENDGGSDNLRSTKLRIARSGSDAEAPVMSGSDDYVKIEAYPSNVNGTRDQFVTNDTALQGNFADEAASKVDGTQARRFTLEGVGKTIKYYYERDGITYFIESWDVSTGDTQLMLDDVVRGFSFN